jgi:PKD repeat protein
MWSNGNVGEGVFNCFDFQQGKEYLICFDLITNGHPNGVFNVRATNGLSAYTANPTPAGSSIPWPSSSQQIFLDALAPYTSWTAMSIPFAPTSDYSQIWFYPRQNVTLATQSEARFDNVVIQEINPALYTVSSDVVICPPANVQLSATGGTSYNWSPSTGLSCTNCANPVATPASTTTYTVEIIDPDLCGPVTREVTVTVDCDCTCDLIPDFMFTQEANCSTYTFTNSSSGNACTNVVGAGWDFGDGVTGTGNTITHTFPGPGVYNVCVAIAGFDGENCCNDSICYPVTVECNSNDCECPLTPDFIFNAEKCEVEFFDRTTTDCDVISMHWDFGDGTYASVANPIHHFNGSGIYNVCLTVVTFDPETEECCIDSVCYDVEVSDCEPCECEITLRELNAEVMGCEVNFMADIEAECEIVDIFWDFGDGNTVSGNFSPMHSYTYNGTYHFCVTISYIDANDSTCTKTFCDVVIVEDCDPAPCAEAGDPESGKTSSVNPQGDVSSSLGLSVYPNPSSGLVSISFHTPTAGKVEINVHDATGKHVTTISNTDMEDGEHTVSWDPSALGMSYGMYHILVKYGEKGETVKFIYER